MHPGWSWAMNARRMRGLFPRHILLLSRAYSRAPPTVLSRQDHPAIDPTSGEPPVPLDIEVNFPISTSVLNIVIYLSTVACSAPSDQNPTS